MIVCAAGDIHGAVDRLYGEVLDFEAALGVGFAWILHVGDFGVWQAGPTPRAWLGRAADLAARRVGQGAGPEPH